jgi:hypothetical protein
MTPVGILRLLKLMRPEMLRVMQLATSYSKNRMHCLLVNTGMQKT